MANYFKQLDKEKARQQNVGYQEFILTKNTIYIGFGGKRPDVHTEALRKATTYQNLGRAPSVSYAPDPDHFFDEWETSLSIEGLERQFSS